MKRIISGLFLLAFGLLGMYCSLQAFENSHGRDGWSDQSVRNWSTGAMACIVACGVIATLSRKNTSTAAGGAPSSPWWKNPVGMTLLAAVAVVVVIVVISVLKRPPLRKSAPVVVPLQLDPPRVPLEPTTAP